MHVLILVSLIFVPHIGGKAAAVIVLRAAVCSPAASCWVALHVPVAAARFVLIRDKENIQFWSICACLQQIFAQLGYDC